MPIKMTIAVPKTWYEVQVTNAEFDIIQTAYKEGRALWVIKFIRLQYDLGLKESKDICDVVAKMPKRDAQPTF